MSGRKPRKKKYPEIDKAGRDICLNCPLPYCVGGKPGKCSLRFLGRQSYERHMYESGRLGGSDDVFDD